MIKIREERLPRGWEALKLVMQKEGFSNNEIEEAEESFRNGIKILARLYHSTCSDNLQNSLL